MSCGLDLFSQLWNEEAKIAAEQHRQPDTQMQATR